MRIWIDTDIGTDVDDALALAYVLRHPGLELAGVSTVFGDVVLRKRIAEALLELDAAPLVPVLPGLGVPGTPGRKGIMFGHEGKGVVDVQAPQLRIEQESGGEARIEALAEALSEASADALLAIGPLTNLAALLRAGVELPPLAIMGGKLEDVMLAGMVPHISEWNWFSDPLAVQAVLSARHQVRPRVVPAEVTSRTRLDPGDVELLAAGDPLAQALATLCLHWLTAQKELLGSKRPGIALHDPLTAATLVEVDLCPFEERRIQVDGAGATQRESGPPNVAVAVDVDVREVRDHLMATWLA